MKLVAQLDGIAWKLRRCLSVRSILPTLPTLPTLPILPILPIPPILPILPVLPILLVLFILFLLFILPSIQNLSKGKLFAQDGDIFSDQYEWGGFFRQGMHLLEIPAGPANGAEEDSLMFSLFNALQLGGSLESDHFRWESAAELNFIFSNRGNSPLFSLVWDQQSRNRPLSGEQSALGQDHLLGYELQRLTGQFQRGALIIKVGRQAISWGQGRFLNPLNLVTPIDPFVLDIESIPGADAIDISFYFNDTDYLEAVMLPYQRYNRENWRNLQTKESNYLLRYQSTWENVDAALLAGYHFHSYVWGGEASIAAWQANLRFAYLGRKDRQAVDYLTSLSPESDRELAEEKSGRRSDQFVVGVSYLFFGRFSFNGEMFWNLTEEREQLLAALAYEAGVRSGLQEPLPEESSFFLTEGRIVTRQPLYAQFSLSYNLTDLLEGSLFLIYDLQGKSSASLLQLNYSLSDETVLISSINFVTDGEENGEFSRQPSSFYVFVRQHF